MSQLNKSNLEHSGKEIMSLILLGGNDDLIMMYLTLPELYTNNPQAVHRNLKLFLKQNFQIYVSLYCAIARMDAAVLVPHFDIFLNQIGSAMGTMVLMIIDHIAEIDPSLVYKHISTIGTSSANVASGDVYYARIVGKIAFAKVSGEHAVDHAFGLLLALLDKKNVSSDAIEAVLTEISNIMGYLSDRSVLVSAMDKLAKFKSAAEVIYVSIDDYAAGRSLLVLTEKVSALDKKVNALNAKVAQTCTNLSDVIAYVDANMADMKDFLAEVVKKLPTPKRLQIDGTLRKTLILVFECSRTGLEFGITSTEWSKWLKIGFSLVKAGTAVIDLGMGNPLGILKKGVECVQEIYSAYKSEDDEEFNTYITQPFLTSAEQDNLLTKLRDQGFFDKFEYDPQTHGWFLVDPEKDGQVTYGAEALSHKERVADGFSLVQGLVGLAGEAGVPVDGLQTMLDQYGKPIAKGVGVAVGVASTISDKLSAKQQAGGDEVSETSQPETNDRIDHGDSSIDVSINPILKSGGGSGVGGSNAVSGKRAVAPVVGARASALKATFSAEEVSSADDKLAQANALVASNKRVAELEAKVASLEKRMDAFVQDAEKNSKKGGCFDYLNSKGISKISDIETTVKKNKLLLDDINCPNCMTLGFVPSEVSYDDSVRDYSRSFCAEISVHRSYYDASPSASATMEFARQSNANLNYSSPSRPTLDTSNAMLLDVNNSAPPSIIRISSVSSKMNRNPSFTNGIALGSEGNEVLLDSDFQVASSQMRYITQSSPTKVCRTVDGNSIAGETHRESPRL
eukprot:gene27260-33954_t